MEDKQTEEISGSEISVRNINICAIITARGGSKGIPKKNLANLSGKPLLFYTIEVAKQSLCFSRIILSSDDQEILDYGQAMGIMTLSRPKELAKDASTSEDVVLHVLNELEEQGLFYNYFMLLQPTSPLRCIQDIQRAISIYCGGDFCSLSSVTLAEHSPYKMFQLDEESFKPLFGEHYLTMPRQKLPQVYRVNGAIYIENVREFKRTKSFFNSPMKHYIMPFERSVDIDNPMDLKIAEYLMKLGSEDK